jgi:hypothetical protein
MSIDAHEWRRIERNMSGPTTLATFLGKEFNDGWIVRRIGYIPGVAICGLFFADSSIDDPASAITA